MNKYENQYIERKAVVVNYLDKVSNFFKNQDKDDIAVSLINLKNNVEHNLFSIVLVGEFSAGKSTFLNALMHKKILPSFTSETTATVNFLRHKDEAPNGEAGIVYYNDGHQEILPDLELSTIEKVVSTRGNEENKNIATTINHVDLFLDSEFLKKGVMLVDSPGLNGVADNHREITEKQIRASHASIFVFSADHPGSKTDFEFVKNLREQYGNKSNNIFYVLNKIDAIRKNEGQTIESVVNDLKESYAKQFPEDDTMPHIYPLSGYAALVARDKNMMEYIGGEIVFSEDRRQELEVFSQMEKFEERLWKYLTEGEKAQIQLLEPINISISELNKEKIILEEQRRFLESKDGCEELIKQKDFLEREIVKLKDKEKEMRSSELNEEIKLMVDELKNELISKVERLRENEKDELESLDDMDNINEYISDLKFSLEKEYRRITSSLEESLQVKMKELIKEECEEYFSEIENKLRTDDKISIEEVKLKDFDSNIEDIEDINNNLEINEEKLEEINRKIKEQKNELKILRKKSVEIEEQQEKQEEIDNELMKLEIEKKGLEATILPDAIYKTETRTIERERGGFLGWIADKAVGKKREQEEYTVRDTKDRDDAKAELDKKIEVINDNFNKKLKEKSEIKFEKSGRMIAWEIGEKQEEIDELTKQLEEEQDKFIKSMERDYEKAYKKLSRKVKAYIEDCSDNYIEVMKKNIGKQKQQYKDIILEVSTNEIQQELEKQNKKLDDILAKINIEGEERDKILNIVNNNLDSISLLENEASEIKLDLENNLNDVIEQEQIVR